MWFCIECLPCILTTYKSAPISLHALVSGYVEWFFFSPFPSAQQKEESVQNVHGERKKEKETYIACAWNKFFLSYNHTRFCSEIRPSLESLNTSLAALGTMSKGQGMWRDRYTNPFFFIIFPRIREEKFFLNLRATIHRDLLAVMKIKQLKKLKIAVILLKDKNFRNAVYIHARYLSK